MSDWQPIDTAPTDGTWIMVTHWRSPPQADDDDWRDEPPVRIVRRAETGGGFFYEPAAVHGLFRQVPMKQREFWATEIGGEVTDPTHWMPVPSAPA